MKIKKENLKKLGLTEDNLVWPYPNGDYEYKKDEIYYVLNPVGKLKCKGDDVWSYPNGDYVYEKDEKRYCYHKEDNYWTINGIKIKDFEGLKKWKQKKKI